MKRFGLLLIVVGLLVPAFVLAQVPTTISYQGRLDSSGVPIKSPKNLTFAIYGAATGGTALWTETQSSVPFTGGMFSVKLGSVTAFPATLFTATGERWLGVTIAGGTEMTPRFQFTSTPFAMRALNTDNVVDNAVTSEKIVDGSVATADLADNSVTAAKIAAGQVVKGLNGIHDEVVLATSGGATISASGNTITINAGSGSAGGSITSIQNTNNTLDVVNPTGPTVTVNVKNAGITATQLADNSITTAKIADGTISPFDLGDLSVRTAKLADNAVTAAKIFDEPGMVQGQGNTNVLVPLTSTGKAIISITLNAPAAGYAYVHGQTEVFVSHVNGSWDNIIGKLSTTSGDVTSPAGPISLVRVPGELPTGGLQLVIPMSITYVFPAAAGANTFYLNMYESTGTGNDNVLNSSITAIYLPTAYGAVSAPAPQGNVAGGTGIDLQVNR